MCIYNKYIIEISLIFPTNFSDEICEFVYLLFADSLRVGFLPIFPQHNRVFIQFSLAIYKHIYAIYIIYLSGTRYPRGKAKQEAIFT